MTLRLLSYNIRYGGTCREAALAAVIGAAAPDLVVLQDATKLPRRLQALVWLSGGRIRWRTIQTILDAGYLDAFRYHEPDLVGSTFPTWDPHVRLDYLFVPCGSIGAVRSCTVMTAAPAPAASDHFPLMAELDV